MVDYSALHHAEEARRWAQGTLEEKPEGSAKHWAESLATSIPPIEEGDAGSVVAVKADESGRENRQIIASDAEYAAGTETTKAPTVKQVVDNAADKTLNNLGGAGYGKLMMNVWCANSGNGTPATGLSDLASASGSIVSFKVDSGAVYGPLVVTFADGETKTLTSVDSLNFPEMSNGLYKVFVNKLGQTLAKKDNIIFIQDKRPSLEEEDAVWLDTSSTPYKSYVNSDGAFIPFDYAPLPLGITINAGAISEIGNYRYNNTTRRILSNQLTPDWSRTVGFASGYIAPTAGFVKVAKENAEKDTSIVVYINGVTRFYEVNADYTSFCVTFPVSKGDVITYGGHVTTTAFTPLKGI